jgi:hypothetical protein
MSMPGSTSTWTGAGACSSTSARPGTIPTHRGCCRSTRPSPISPK